MSSKLSILNFLEQEAAKIPSTDNPLLGIIPQPGDIIVGHLLEEELQLLRLVGFYHDQAIALAGGRPQNTWTKETQDEIDRLMNLKGLAQDLVNENVMHRLGWKHFNIGYQEDGSVVTF